MSGVEYWQRQAERERVLRLINAWWLSVKWAEDLELQPLLDAIADGTTTPPWESAF